MPRSSYSARSRDDNGPVFLVLVIAILISAALIVTQSGEARLRKSVQVQSDSVVSPLITLITRPIRASEGLFGSMSDRRRAYEENLVLRAELQQLREENSRLRVSQEEIARYEDMLSVTIETNVPLKRVAARTVNDLTGPFVRALLIDAGKDKGIKLGQAVMTSDGLVGHVILAGSNSSRILRLDDLNSRIPVINERAGSVAILAGDNSRKPKLIFSEIDADWQEGDIIVTSGDDGRLPRGLHIGTIDSVVNDEVRVSVSSFQKPLDWVWVAIFDPIAEPEAISETILSENMSEAELSAAPTHSDTTNNSDATNNDDDATLVIEGSTE